jgi:hypothetical protein
MKRREAVRPFEGIRPAAVEKEISTGTSEKSFRMKLPLIKSKNPKTLSMTHAKIENLLA